MVLNAFIRRGFKIGATQGIKALFLDGFPLRLAYGPLPIIPFSPKVEDYD
jgi:hypothetical protein